MSLKKLSLVVMALASLFAVFAGSASAEVTTPTTIAATWKNGSTAFPAAGKTPKCSAKTNFVLKGTILSSEAELTATGMSCSATLKNETVEGVAMAGGSGTLSFTGITVNKPAGCKLNGEANGSAKLTTESVHFQIDMTHHEKIFNGSNPVQDPFPVKTVTPDGTNFAKIKLTGCAAEGNYPITGKLVGEATKETGVGAVNQVLKFNSMTNEAKFNEAGTGGLTLGGNPASITGEENDELTTGEAFQVN